jgi:flagellar biosynthesis protein FlhB
MSEKEDSQEERLLEPTERRLAKAREEGQFPQSRDLTTLFVLLVTGIFLLIIGDSLALKLHQLVSQGLTIPAGKNWLDHLQTWGAGPLLELALWIFVLWIPVWIISAIAPLALVNLRPQLAFRFDTSRLDPIKGFQRIFSVQTLTEVGKNLLKIFLVFGIGILYLISMPESLMQMARQDLKGALASTTEIISGGFLLIMIPVTLIAIVDVILQNFNFRKRMRMSHEELKQELKETEGSPDIRAKIRQRQRQIATSRMMSALEKADVVLANPEHFAVALRYDSSKMAAPVIVAKGVDLIAQRIQSVAKDFNVPVARIPPLARLLYKELDIGDPIPADLFEAVARVLAWAYEVKEDLREAADLPEIGKLPRPDTLASGQAS